MPSLRKRVSSYFRQLSFHNEPRNKRNNVNENAFVTKYLQGHITICDGPEIIHGKIPTDLPNYDLAKYQCGSNTITGCYSGPNGGLTTIKRTEKHLSVPDDDDIDFIDTAENDEEIVPSSPIHNNQLKTSKPILGQPIDNTTMIIKVAGNEYCVTNKPKRHSKSLSLGSISDFNAVSGIGAAGVGGGGGGGGGVDLGCDKTGIIEVEKTKIDKEFYKNLLGCDSAMLMQKDLCKKEESFNSSNNNDENNLIGKKLNEENQIINKILGKAKGNESEHLHTNNRFNKISKKEKLQTPIKTNNNNNNNTSSKSYSLTKSKSEGNPFQHHQNKKKGKIIQTQRIQQQQHQSNQDSNWNSNDSMLPIEWNRKSEYIYGISDSLYDQNQITKEKNGNPIADCFGIIERNDSAIIAVADGVNWGEKACIAAKCAVHASLYYLNKTIFNDIKTFDVINNEKTEDNQCDSSLNHNLITNTKDVFICLLRAFRCAHDLILENKGMLTTLTVAVVLPLKQKSYKKNENGELIKLANNTDYICCVCNVGDTLAYVYSQKYGMRELTKGSHDVNCNRDMRDALGALGPVDGTNPELSNLTLSITTISKGDIILIASDGLTDNFDPNVCKFTVNSDQKGKFNKTNMVQQKASTNHIPCNNKNGTGSDTTTILVENHIAPPTITTTTTTPTTTSIQSIATTVVGGQKPPIKPPRKSKSRGGSMSSTNSSIENDVRNSIQEFPLNDKRRIETIDSSTSLKKTQFVIDNKASSLRKQISSQKATSSITTTTITATNANATSSSSSSSSSYKFLKSKTSLDLRHSNNNNNMKRYILRNIDGIPFVTPIQRYELQLLLMQDILKNGISGHDRPITTAKKLCENLVSFTMSITSAKRKTLEDPDLYYDNRGSVSIELSNHEKKLRRKRVLEKIQNLPGKLDHVTVVACNIGGPF